MNRILRLLRHRGLDVRDARRVLDDAALERLTAQVRQSESRHGGEIRICVEAGLPLRALWRGTRARERALAVFGELRVWDTEANNGVLIYLLLAEHAIEIVCDRAVARVVTQAQWGTILAGLRQALQGGRFEAGLSEAVSAVDALLTAHFGREPGSPDRNELPDAPLRR
jgi:uncharacterized membrane protein